MVRSLDVLRNDSCSDPGAGFGVFERLFDVVRPAHGFPTPPLGFPNSIAPPPGVAASPSTIANNAHIECSMVHLRNLIEFLFNLNPVDTDVVAKTFAVQVSGSRRSATR
jgi:hypothetical protein